MGCAQCTAYALLQIQLQYVAFLTKEYINVCTLRIYWTYGQKCAQHVNAESAF